MIVMPRFATPKEVARLMGFPEACTLDSVTDQQAYALLGNSLNCVVVAALVLFLLHPDITPPSAPAQQTT